MNKEIRNIYYWEDELFDAHLETLRQPDTSFHYRPPLYR